MEGNTYARKWKATSGSEHRRGEKRCEGNLQRNKGQGTTRGWCGWLAALCACVVDCSLQKTSAPRLSKDPTNRPLRLRLLGYGTKRKTTILDPQRTPFFCLCTPFFGSKAEKRGPLGVQDFWGHTKKMKKKKKKQHLATANHLSA